MSAPTIRARTAEHLLADGEARLLGAVSTVTGAMTRLDLGGARLLVDCGIAQGREASRWVFPPEAAEVDAVLLTHGHQDHIGSLPALLEAGYRGPIYATAATLEVARISLEDSLDMNRIDERDIKRFLHDFNQLARMVPYDRPIEPMRDRGITARFVEAGHILGSASIDLQSERSRIILSGDLGRPDSPILLDPCTSWGSERPVDLVVCECTYGNRDHAHDAESIKSELREVITATVRRRGKVLIPAFAIGRTQVLLYFLNDLVESGALPPVPVAIDTPMGLSITETYDHFRNLFDKEAMDRLQRGDDPLDFRSLFAVRSGRDSFRLTEHDGPFVIIAGSGMCQGGRILRHLKEGLDDPRNTVLFVGHQSTGTLGQRILDAETGARLRIEGQEIEVLAERRVLKGLSAHADRSELCAWLSHLPSPRAIALHHGEAEAQDEFVKFATERLAAR